MNHLRWMGHASTIFEIQKNLRNDLESCEVTLVAKGIAIRAHRFVLSSCSDLLRALLADVPLGQEATIVVPDIKGALLESVMSFIYMGETNLISSNLSEFLEAINTLGIKSAISFECNTISLAGNGATPLPIKAITELEMGAEGQEELLDQEAIVTQKLDAEGLVTEQPATGRDLEFLDMYNDGQHKITYSIEHIPGAATGNEFILTENSGTFTLTQNSKLETSSNADSTKLDDTEDDVEDATIIEGYSSGPDPIIEIADGNHSGNSIAITATPLSSKQKTHKFKTASSSSGAHLSDSMDECSPKLNTIAADPIGLVAVGAGEDAIELAVQAVITEGLSLQKAAHKYDLSKTVLWRRVRKHPEYMKTARTNPILNLAYDRLKSGEPLKTISKELDIPMSTLHRHKVRLAQQGHLPDYVTCKKRTPDTKDELRAKLSKAVHACVHSGMSQNQAANLYEIPKSTLWRHLQKRVAEAELSEKMDEGDIKEEVILS